MARIATILALGLCALLLNLLLAPATAEGAKDNERTGPNQMQGGGYEMGSNDMSVQLKGPSIGFYNEAQSGYGNFTVTLDTLAFHGDLAGNGPRAYQCRLQDMAWNYETAPASGIITAYADLDLVRVDTTRTGQADAGGDMGTRAGSYGPAPEEGTGNGSGLPPETGAGNVNGTNPGTGNGTSDLGPQEGNGTGQGPQQDATLENFGRLRIIVTKLEGSGMKFDISLEMAKPLSAPATIRLHQVFGGSGRTYEQAYQKDQGTQSLSGAMQLKDGERAVASYSWAYGYSTGLNATPNTRELADEVNGGISFNYAMGTGENRLYHDPQIDISVANITAIVKEAAKKTVNTLYEHRVSILTGLVIGVILVLVVSVIVVKASGFGDDTLDIKKNRYYKR